MTLDHTVSELVDLAFAILLNLPREGRTASSILTHSDSVYWMIAWAVPKSRLWRYYAQLWVCDYGFDPDRDRRERERKTSRCGALHTIESYCLYVKEPFLMVDKPKLLNGTKCRGPHFVLLGYHLHSKRVCRPFENFKLANCRDQEVGHWCQVRSSWLTVIQRWLNFVFHATPSGIDSWPLP